MCFAPEGDFYKEEAVERMCGICGMFRAEDGFTAATPGAPAANALLLILPALARARGRLPRP